MEKMGGHFEGIIRRDFLFNGRYIDQYVFSILDYEWPAMKKVIAEWLDPSNFDDQGREKKPLKIIRDKKE